MRRLDRLGTDAVSGLLVALFVMFLVSLSVPVRAAGPRDLESLFPLRADVTTDGAGLVRLTLPANILRACKGDLSDLRLVDLEGQEIAYLVDSGLPEEFALEAREIYQPETLAAGRTTQSREEGPSILTETYVVSTPAAPPDSGTWELVLAASRSRFVRRVSVSVGDPEDGGRMLVADASIFRLPDPPRQQLALQLPTLEAPELTVTLVGEEDFFLEPTFVFEARRRLADTAHATLELEEIESMSLDGKTRVRLERPRGLVPDTLRIRTSSPALNRRVEVWDEGPGSSTTPLADETVQRLEQAQELEIRLRPATGARLEVVIHDGGSPPLADVVFEAVVRRPALVFSVAESSTDRRSATLLFGGGRAYPPRYDLAGLIPDRTRRISGDEALVAERLFDAEKLGTARLGPQQDNPGFDPSPALSFAMRPGVEVNPRAFSHSVTVRVGDSPEGLLRLTIPPGVSADARTDLGDLRLVDGQQRQWSYLLERDAGRIELAIRPARPRRGEDKTRYHLPLSVVPLRVDQLVLDARDEFFDRGFEVVGRQLEAKRGEATLASGRLVRRLGDPRKVRIDLPGVPLESLELGVDDGDDPSLDLYGTSVRVPVSELYFAAPAGNYDLLYGNPDETAPRYELASVRDVVLAAQSLDAELGQPSANPAYSIGARFSKGSALQQILLWGALAAAVAVLAWLTLRLARQE
ncbi:MAG: hypothetical protein OES47_13390 [Acidobacteriota bacterium]|nr:hypothetical protein [Acidobacteriota bacterium]